MIRILLVFLLLIPVSKAFAGNLTDKHIDVLHSETSSEIMGNVEDDWLGKGLGMALVGTRDTDGFERKIVRVGTMVRYESKYDFIAVGVTNNYFRQGNWSTNVLSLGAAIRKVDRATAAGVTGRAALAIKGGRIRLHGEGTWNVRFSESTGTEVVLARDVVESKEALKSLIMSNFFGVSLDHAITERLTVIGMPTYRLFSDGNRQVGVRGWLIYNIIPKYGLSLQTKFKNYSSSHDGGGAYFSPMHYEQAEIGLRLRRSFGDWRTYATADIGKERINRSIIKPTRRFVLSAERTFANDAALGLQYAYYKSSDSSTANIDNYWWHMMKLTLLIPF